MSSFRPHRESDPLTHRSRATSRRIVPLAAAAAIVAVSIGLLIGFAVTGDDGAPTTAATSGHEHGGALPPGYRLTGEVSPMGGQIIETPGTRGGAAAAGGVEVTDGADIAMGHIPLAFAVNPTWHLRNTTDAPVTLGKPKVAVVEGCCPAEPVLGASTLAPGAETTLEFPTQMHPGMDGAHLFRLTVPVGASGDQLVVSVAGDFS